MCWKIINRVRNKATIILVLIIFTSIHISGCEYQNHPSKTHPPATNIALPQEYKHATKDDLIHSLGALRDAMLTKIDWDVDDVAQSFTSVKDYWREKRWADIARAPLRVLENTVKIYSMVLNPVILAENFEIGINDAQSSYDLISLLLMYQGLQDVGEGLYIGLYGPTYPYAINSMLELADATTEPPNGFSNEHYKLVIENHIHGIQGDPVVIIPRHSTDANRDVTTYANGSMEVSTSIKNTFNDLIEDIEAVNLPEEFPFDKIVIELDSLRKQVLLSNLKSVGITYTADHSEEVETTLGAIADRKEVWRLATGNLAQEIEMETEVEIQQSGKSIMLVFTHIFPGSTAVKTLQKLTTLTYLGIKSLERKYHTDPETSFYMIPQEMLLTLPMELSNLWMISDDLDQYIRSLMNSLASSTPIVTETILQQPESLTPAPNNFDEGWIVFSVSEGDDYGLYKIRSDGSELTRLSNEFDNIAHFDYSTNGGEIIFNRTQEHKYQIWLMNSDGTNLHQITDPPKDSAAPRWSPNENYIVFLSGPEDHQGPGGLYELFVIEPDSGEQKFVGIIWPIVDKGRQYDWSSDSQNIVYSDGTLVVEDLFNNDTYPLSPGILPRWSPMSEEIAFVSTSTGEYEDIYLMNTDGSGLTQLTQGYYTFDIEWSPNGNEIAFIGGNTGIYEGIFIINIETKKVILLTENPQDGLITDLLWSPDGSKVLFVLATSGYEYYRQLYSVNNDGSDLKLLYSTDSRGHIFTIDWVNQLPSEANIALTTMNDFSPNPWPMYRSDTQRSGNSSNSGPKIPKLKWEFHTEGSISSPVISADGTVYVDSTDGNLYALDPVGKTKWNFSTTGDWPADLAIVQDGTILLAKNNSLIALHSDGYIKWTYYIDQGISDVVIGPDGTIYIGSKCLHALGQDGKIIWGIDKGMCDLLGFIDIAIAADGNIYGLSGLEVYAFSPDGTFRWKEETAPGARGFNTAITLDSQGFIYVSAEAATGAQTAFLISKLEILNPWGGYRKSFDEYISTPPTITSNGTFHIDASEDKGPITTEGILTSDLGPPQLQAIDSNDSVLWSFPVEHNICSYPVSGGDGTVYFVFSNGDLYAFDPSGNVKWVFNIGESQEYCHWWEWKMAIGIDTIYISTENTLYAIGEAE